VVRNTDAALVRLVDGVLFVTLMVASASPLSASSSATSFAGLEARRGGRVRGQRDRDRPEQAARRPVAVAYARPVCLRHEPVERREAPDAEHDEVALFARADAYRGSERARARPAASASPAGISGLSECPPWGATRPSIDSLSASRILGALRRRSNSVVLIR